MVFTSITYTPTRDFHRIDLFPARKKKVQSKQQVNVRYKGPLQVILKPTLSQMSSNISTPSATFLRHLSISPEKVKAEIWLALQDGINSSMRYPSSNAIAYFNVNINIFIKQWWTFLKHVQDQEIGTGLRGNLWILLPWLWIQNWQPTWPNDGFSATVVCKVKKCIANCDSLTT